MVLASRLSSADAEVVATSLAQSRLGSWDLGADGSPVRDDWDVQEENHGIKDVLREEALAVYADYRQAVREQSPPVYNARGTGDLADL